MLFVERSFKGLEFVFLQNTSFPPGFDEAEAVAHQLDKSRRDGEQTHPETAVADAGVDEDDKGIEEQWQQGEDAQHKANALVHIVGRTKIVGIEPLAIAVHSCTECEKQDAGDDAKREDGGQQVDELQGAGVALLKVDAGDAAVIYLAEELTEIRAALVPYPGVGEKTWLIASLDDTVGEIDVFAEAHLREAAQFQIDITTDAHVKGAGVEFVELGFAAADTTGSEERGHRVADGLLDRRERGVGSVGTAESREV